MDINKYSYKARLTVKNIIGTSDLVEPEIYEVLHTARLIDKKKRAGVDSVFLKNKQIFIAVNDRKHLLPLAPLESAVYELGGNVIRLDAQNLQGNTRYLAKNLIYSDASAIVFAGFDDEYLDEFAKQSSVPVINGISRDCNPIQALTDLYTLWQSKSTLSGLKLAFYAKSASANINSLIISAAKVGCETQLLTPTDIVLERATNTALQYGGYSLNNSNITLENQDAVYFDFKSGEFDVKEIKNILSYLCENVAILCPSSENIPANTDIFDKIDGEIFKQMANKVTIYKALLKLLVGAEKD